MTLQNNPPERRPEHWQTDAGSDPVAVLNIPGLLSRARVFDMDATLIVAVPGAAQDAWLELTVEIDGQRQWNRRIAAHNPGQTDGLEYPTSGCGWRWRRASAFALWRRRKGCG